MPIPKLPLTLKNLTQAEVRKRCLKNTNHRQAITKNMKLVFKNQSIERTIVNQFQ